MQDLTVAPFFLLRGRSLCGILSMVICRYVLAMTAYSMQGGEYNA